MNRKFGLAATAWMLGSGLLLDAGLNAEEQLLSTQPANNATTALPSAEGSRDNTSPIQQKIEDMYRRGGRPLPQLNFHRTPINTAPQSPTASTWFRMPGSRPAVTPNGQIQRPTPIPSKSGGNPSSGAPRSRAQANRAVYEDLAPSKITRRVQPIGHEEEASAKKAPRLLSDFLRSTQKPISENTAKPAASAPLSAAHKILGNTAVSNRSGASAQPSRSRPDTHSAIQPAGMEEVSPDSQPNSQNGFAPSPIQQQLEDMYRRDGRSAPQLNFQPTPNNTAPQPPTARSRFQMPGSRPTVMPKGIIQRPTPMPSLGPPNPNAVTPNSKVSRTGGFLSRINPFKSRSTSLPPQPPTSAPTSMGAAGKPASDSHRLQPQSTLAPNGVGIGGATPPKPMTFQPAAAAPIPPQPAPATNASVAPRSELSDTLPPLPGDPDFQATTIPTTPAASVDEALHNAFTEIAEDAADGKHVDNPKADNSQPDNRQKDSSPFSGLSLDSHMPVPPEPQAAEMNVSPESATNGDAPKDSTADAPKDSTADAERQDLPLSSQTSDEHASKEATDAKLKRIAERTDLQGLKGFCPVALRDDRDLQNALPEHASRFKGRTYYFSSADAKAAFDEQPEQYAPMARGNDVVLLKTMLTREGSLDFAVWYKDRMYLFTSQKTLEQFIATPSEFVVKD